MDYRIMISRPWRPDRRRLIHPGTYRVPEDMRRADADLAFRHGVATKVEPKLKPTVDPPSEPIVSESPSQPANEPVAKTKSRGRPPKNKSALG
jgi:hypothetical protein